MKVILTRILPDDFLSQFRVRDMRPGETITAECENVAEFNKARVNARLGIYERSDGYEYKIKSNSTDNTITVTLSEKESI